jgi:hypothetical protein
MDFSARPWWRAPDRKSAAHWSQGLAIPEWPPPPCCPAWNAARIPTRPARYGPVTQARHRTVGTGLDDDVAEFLLGLQAALRVDGELQLDALCAGRSANTTGRGLHVLLADGVTTSLADKPCMATFCGSSQMRME